MNTVTINGVTISHSGSISVINGKVIVDGKDVTPNAKEINISVDGPIEKLEVDACTKLSVVGNVGNVKTVSGGVDITGNVTGSVSCVSGRVDCGNIGGSVSTVSGAVKHRRV